jgi:hypothetical protein
MYTQHSMLHRAAQTADAYGVIARRKNYATYNPILIIVEQTSAQRRYRAYGFVVEPKRTHNELRVEPIP